MPPVHLLIVPDKFKGTLSARQAADAIARGWCRHRPSDIVTLLPMSDGGDGFGPVLGASLGAQVRRVWTCNAAHEPVSAPWFYDDTTRTALIESAGVIGLAMLPPGQYHPFDLDTRGLGAALQAAAKAGARTCLIGIGGSATNDGGFGLACSLGWKFLDDRGVPIDRWAELHRLKSIQRPPGPLPGFKHLVVAVDVDNPLLGSRGCSRIYGPQKGLRPVDMARAESALRRLATVARSQLGAMRSSTPGFGAAGGLGFGLTTFAGATLQPGAELFAKRVGLSRHLRRADVVITGEGRIDPQSLMGKGVGHVVVEARRQGAVVIGLAGCVQETTRLRQEFDFLGALSPDLTTRERAQRTPVPFLATLSQKAAIWFETHHLDLRNHQATPRRH